MHSEEKILLGKANAQKCEMMRHYLAGHGIEIATIHNKITCSSGCSTELEIWAHAADADQIDALLKELYQQEMRDHGYNADLLNAVYDPTAEEATCPACGIVFSTSHRECPECGLGFGEPIVKKSACASGKC